MTLKDNQFTCDYCHEEKPSNKIARWESDNVHICVDCYKKKTPVRHFDYSHIYMSPEALEDIKNWPSKCECGKKTEKIELLDGDTMACQDCDKDLFVVYDNIQGSS